MSGYWFFNQRIGILGLCVLGLISCAQQPTSPPKPAAVRITEPPLVLRSGHPQQYEIAPGDNVWDVSARFLRDPWRWQGLWSQQQAAARQVELYPGDVVKLEQTPSEPRLHLVKGRGGRIKLTPQIRIENITQAIPTLSREAIAPFILNASVMTEEQWRAAPYIIGAADEAVLIKTGDEFFARGEDLDGQSARYRIFRPGKAYIDPEDNTALGYGMVYLGEAQFLSGEDPVLMRLASAELEVRAGDRLVPMDPNPPTLTFELRSVSADTEGMIIDSLNETLVLGRYSNVAINLGSSDGMQAGHVLGAYRQGGQRSDPVTGEQVQLPPRRTGLILLYKVFDAVSYGLVTEAELDIRLLDRVASPE